MASIPHKTKNGVWHEMSGAGFHTPSKYGKGDRRNEKAEIEAELEDNFVCACMIEREKPDGSYFMGSLRIDPDCPNCGGKGG